MASSAARARCGRAVGDDIAPLNADVRITQEALQDRRGLPSRIGDRPVDLHRLAAQGNTAGDIQPVTTTVGLALHRYPGSSRVGRRDDPPAQADRRSGYTAPSQMGRCAVLLRRPDLHAPGGKINPCRRKGCVVCVAGRGLCIATIFRAALDRTEQRLIDLQATLDPPYSLGTQLQDQRPEIPVLQAWIAGAEENEVTVEDTVADFPATQ